MAHVASVQRDSAGQSLLSRDVSLSPHAETADCQPLFAFIILIGCWLWLVADIMVPVGLT